MWKGKRTVSRGDRKFFRLALIHESLSDYYNTNFILKKEHGYSFAELDAMMPWERDIQVGLLMDYLRDKAAKKQQHFQE
jgi:hypothetical protein